MAYELFQNKAAKFGSPQVTIRAGRIAFNADAGDIFAGVGMRQAHLLWDAGEHKLAVQPVAATDENTFIISIPEGKRGGNITASSFLKYIGWDAKQAVTIDAHWDDTKRLLEAVLPKEHLGLPEGEAVNLKKSRFRRI